MRNELSTCPVCGYKTIFAEWQVCHICRWEFNYFQISHPDDKFGPNYVTLHEAQANFIKFGANDPGEVHHAQKPTPADQKDPEWKPL